jgi:hypothetical protein
MAEVSQSDEVAKYKKVLSLARSSLEANQATIATKDQQNSNKAKKILGREEEATLIPRRILCRVDVEDLIWVLVEYDDYDDCWKSMESEQDLDDFIQRVPGVPLTCPPRCMSSEESNRIVSLILKTILPFDGTKGVRCLLNSKIIHVG